MIERVCCLIMQKNEDALLQPWLDYHGALFGFENIYMWDNGSDSPKLLSTLKEYESKGLHVDYDMTSGTDFRRKGIILGDKIKELDLSGKYDFYFPIDCDEFLAIETDPGKVSCAETDIRAELSSLETENKALGINSAYFNILGQKDYFWRWPHKKTFFRTGTYKIMDHGYHEGVSRIEQGRRDTRFVYIHYHHKPHETIVEHSKAKLRPFMDIDNPEVLQAERAKGNRLAVFITDPKESYMKKFSPEKGVSLPVVADFFHSIGSEVPFQSNA